MGGEAESAGLCQLERLYRYIRDLWIPPRGLNNKSPFLVLVNLVTREKEKDMQAGRKGGVRGPSSPVLTIDLLYTEPPPSPSHAFGTHFPSVSKCAFICFYAGKSMTDFSLFFDANEERFKLYNINYIIEFVKMLYAKNSAKNIVLNNNFYSLLITCFYPIFKYKKIYQDN